LIGQTVTVVEAITDGEGRVKVGDSVWSATGPDAEVGARVRVIASECTVLRVERV
ncbi:MAG: NfeD family protein, partial [Alphaproteobacteria bacterium]